MVASPTPSEEASRPVPRVGQLLYEARQSRGVTVEEAAEATNISARYLRALESDAALDEFPAPVYARFFLREYARYLGLDEEAVVARFEAEYHTRDQETLPVIPGAIKTPGRALAKVLPVVAIAALVAIGVLSLASRQPERAAPIPGISPRAETTSPPPAPKSTNPGPSAPRAIKTTLRLNGPCWVHVVADGKVKVSDTLLRGASVSIRAKKTLSVVLGSAGAVDMRLNGKSVSTGDLGEVVHLEFALRDGRVVRTQ